MHSFQSSDLKRLSKEPRNNILPIFLRKIIQVHKQQPYQHADVHGKEHPPPAAVIGRGSQAGDNALCLSDVTGSMICMKIPYTYDCEK